MDKPQNNQIYDVNIIGGLGHVGLPLGLVFASNGLRVCLYDKNTESAAKVKSGKMPFIEYGAEEILKEVLETKHLDISCDIETISSSKYVVIAIGTPVDEYLNPKTRQFLEIFKSLIPYLNINQTIIVRSSIYPHTLKQMLGLLKNSDWKLAYCPERIVQGYSVKELKQLPQIIAAYTSEAVDSATDLFNKISPVIVKTTVEEAELVKLFSNAWRYIQFAITNQFYMICKRTGVDYDKVRNAMVQGYGRVANLPTAGFAAGPCLLKDTMQLASFSGNQFLLGHSARMINEGLPNFIVEELQKEYDLSAIKVGILGMAFKADIDDIRDSLSYKIGKILRFHGTDVYYSDEYAKNPDFCTKEQLINKCDVVIIGVPHTAYKTLIIPKSVHIVDLWGITRNDR